jgi:hypothetical protein
VVPFLPTICPTRSSDLTSPKSQSASTTVYTFANAGTTRVQLSDMDVSLT